MMGSCRSWLCVTVVALIALAGCASYPISDQYRASASRDVNFTMVLRNPDAYAGAIVIWGGRIVETTNTPGGSEIIVLETPLNGWEEPGAAEYSPGRFIAQSSDFLDPAIYAPGRRITLAGQVVRGEKRPLGTTEYAYPLVAVKQLHLWPVPKMQAYEPVDYWPWWRDYGWAYDPNYWRVAPVERGERRGEEHHGEGQGHGGHEGGDREGR
jgi:outer membrane lipoprotein